jgi:hypothetical protein
VCVCVCVCVCLCTIVWSILEVVAKRDRLELGLASLDLMDCLAFVGRSSVAGSLAVGSTGRYGRGSDSSVWLGAVWPQKNC